jgi:hypothetical protein
VKKIGTHTHNRCTTKDVLTMKKNKAIFTLLASSALFGVIGVSGLALSNANESVHETSVLAKRNASAFDFSDETELPSENLAVVLSSSTTTELTQSFTVSLSSEVATLKDNNWGCIYFASDDPEFSTDLPTNPGGTAPEFNGYVYAIKGAVSPSDIVIPEVISFGTRARLNITRIGSHIGLDSFANITSIYIPSSIETIEKNAFAGIDESVTVNCEAASAKAGWETSWIDSTNVHYGVSNPGDRRLPGTIGDKFSNGMSYITGYYGEGKMYQPLVATFDVKNGNKVEQREQVVGLQSENTIYDAIGARVGSNAISIALDIPLNKGDVVDPTTFCLHNIYGIQKDQILPDLDGGAYFATPAIGFKKNLDISDFIKVEPGTASTFAGHTQINIRVTKVDGIYAELKESIYKEFLPMLQRGAASLRYQFFALGYSRYGVAYRSGNETIHQVVPVLSPVDYCLIEGGSVGEVGFIFRDVDLGPGFSYQNIEEVTLENFNFKLDIYNNETHAIVNRSALSVRFGSLTLINNTDAPAAFHADLNLAAFLTALIYSLLFIGGSAGYYFYAKNKYKNDEFRRMNTKRFLFTAGKNFVGFGIVTLFIFFAIGRWGVMNTSVVAYNPLDVFVIVFGIVGLIFIGFAIKNLVVAIKQARKNREALRLKLDEDVADDGTK